ncbi:MAG: hypothetical protein U0793_31615 [Gemmataceae bacterium]
MGTSIKSLFGLATLLVGHMLPTTTAAQEKKPDAATFQTFRGGLVLLDEKAAYAVNPLGCLDALDHQTGRVLWTAFPDGYKEAKGCYWPLAVYGRLLVVRERDPDRHEWGKARIAFLDLDQKGKVVKRLEAVEFPVFWWNDPVFQSVGGRPPDPISPAPVYRSESHVQGDKLLIAWRSRTAKPSAKEATKAGVIEVDLESGKVRELPADKALTEPKEPAEVTLGERKFVVKDITSESRSGPGGGIYSTSTVPTLVVSNPKTAKIAWQYTLRGGSGLTINTLVPTRPPGK